MKSERKTKDEPQARRRRLDRVVLLDDDGEKVRSGDEVCFSYGIPPIYVISRIVQRGKSLIALTPGHIPPECNLRTLRRNVGCWYKQNTEFHAPSKAR